MKRWINTLVLYNADGNVVRREGYWYDGPVDLAVTMASFDQDSYAFYDDGTESGSTQIGSTNTQTTLDVDTNLQCRILIQETAGGTGNTGGGNFEYNHNSGGWVTVSTVSSVIQQVDSANLTDGGDTTQRIGAGTFIVTNGWVTEIDNFANLNFAANEECEGLLSFQIIGSDVSNGDEVLIRMGGMDVYTREADIDVNKGGAARRVFVIS